MKIAIKTHNVTLTKALKEYATKKMDKLSKFFDNIQDVVVELHMNDVADVNKRQVTLINLHASGTTIRVEESSADLYASIDLAFENAGRQLKKHKEKLRDHKKANSAKRLAAAEPTTSSKSSATAKQAAHEPDDLYQAKPMEIEEAARILKEKHLPFLVFRNFKTEKINIVYPTGKSSFGLIDPS